MSQSILPENTPLYLRAKQAILDLIVEALQKGDLEDKKLPPEEELCQRLGVSRPTVREALMALSREGVITKKHGTGNLIHPSALEPRMRFDIYTDFLAMLEGRGYKADLQCSVVRPPTTEEVDILASCGGDFEHGLFQERQYTADGNPAILCYSFLLAVCNQNADGKSDASSDESMDMGNKNYACFLERLSGEEPAHAMTRIQPTVTDVRVADFFRLKEGLPILRIVDRHYSVHDTLLAKSVVYFNPDMLDLSILRKW